MYYPMGNIQGRQLFWKLLHKMEAKQFDDSYLELLANYQALYPSSERCDIFFAHYLMSRGLYMAALEYALAAETKRPVSWMVWKLLISCYRALGKEMEALPYIGYCNAFYDGAETFSVERKDMAQAVHSLSLAMGIADHEPYLKNRVYCRNNGEAGDESLAEMHEACLCGEFIFPGGAEEYRYWSGIYLEEENLSTKGLMMSFLKDNETFSAFHGADMITFDIIKAKIGSDFRIPQDKVPIVVPLAGTAVRQLTRFSSKEATGKVLLGKWAFEYFRVEGETQIQSEKPIVMGAPVYLAHSSKRRKIILNILSDGLCWKAVRESNYALMPNTVEFFSKGIIFNQHFSVAEFTYPSVATIETGLYPHHSHIFHDKFCGKLASHHRTLSEKMRGLGYYCVNVMGGGSGIYNGVLRGYDRLLVTPYNLQSYMGVERVIRQIEAFGECDQFIYLHFMDTHSSTVQNYQMPLVTQTRLPLQERLRSELMAEAHTQSVFLPKTPLYMSINQQGIRNADRSLGVLFAYLREHYHDDEYIVQLYSDHGVPVYDDHPYLLSDYHVGAAYMMRGAGVPERGFVDELTSSVDIYPVLGKLAGFSCEGIDGNLPASLGGRERDYVISNSIYPGQTYKLCIRTKEHECRLESKEVVDEDGTVDLSGADMKIFRRDGARETLHPAIQGKFLRIIREHTRSFNNEGHFWPMMREARPQWFQ